MASPEFWLSFLSNFLATLIAGTIIGTILVWLINRNQAQRQKNIDYYESKIQSSEKAHKYLSIIRDEIKDIINVVEIIQKTVCPSIVNNFVRINIDYWEIIKSGGEVPDLFDPITLQSLSIFYNTANEINILDERRANAQASSNFRFQGTYKLLDSHLHEKLQSLVNMNSSDRIIKLIDQNIEDIEKECVFFQRMIDRQQRKM